MIIVTRPVSTKPAILYLEYIQSSGTQYIDTGFKPNQNTRVTADVTILSIKNASISPFGTRGESTPTAPTSYCVWAMQTGTTINSDFFGGRKSSNFQCEGVRMNIDKNKNVCVVNSITLTNDSATGSASYPLFLFGCNDIGDFDYSASIRMYGAAIYDNDELVHNFKPAKDESGVVCLYDTVSKSYFYNAGSGIFTGGPEV